MLSRYEIQTKLIEAKTIVIKVGSARVSGSEIATNDFLFDLTTQIKALKSQGKRIVLVSSGAIAQGKKIHPDLERKNKGDFSLPEKQALAAIGQNQLLNLYESFFSRANLKIAQILFGKRDVAEESGFLHLKNTFQQLLDWDIIPIVNENDSVSTEEINFGDNDILSGLVAACIGADLLFLLTGVPGFIKEKAVVPWIQEVNEALEAHAKGPSGPGTGGMETKLKAGKLLLPLGIATVILSGEEKNSVLRFMQGEELGTLVYNGESPKKTMGANLLYQHFLQEYPRQEDL